MNTKKILLSFLITLIGVFGMNTGTFAINNNDGNNVLSGIFEQKQQCINTREHYIGDKFGPKYFRTECKEGNTGDSGYSYWRCDYKADCDFKDAGKKMVSDLVTIIAEKRDLNSGTLKSSVELGNGEDIQLFQKDGLSLKFKGALPESKICFAEGSKKCFKLGNPKNFKKEGAGVYSVQLGDQFASTLSQGKIGFILNKGTVNSKDQKFSLQRTGVFADNDIQFTLKLDLKEAIRVGYNEPADVTGASVANLFVQNVLDNDIININGVQLTIKDFHNKYKGGGEGSKINTVRNTKGLRISFNSDAIADLQNGKNIIKVRGKGIYLMKNSSSSSVKKIEVSVTGGVLDNNVIYISNDSQPLAITFKNAKNNDTFIINDNKVPKTFGMWTQIFKKSTGEMNLERKADSTYVFTLPPADALKLGNFFFRLGDGRVYSFNVDMKATTGNIQLEVKTEGQKKVDIINNVIQVQPGKDLSLSFHGAKGGDNLKINNSELSFNKWLSELNKEASNGIGMDNITNGYIIVISSEKIPNLKNISFIINGNQKYSFNIAPNTAGTGTGTGAGAGTGASTFAMFYQIADKDELRLPEEGKIIRLSKNQGVSFRSAGFNGNEKVCYTFIIQGKRYKKNCDITLKVKLKIEKEWMRSTPGVITLEVEVGAYKFTIIKNNSGETGTNGGTGQTGETGGTGNSTANFIKSVSDGVLKLIQQQ